MFSNSKKEKVKERKENRKKNPTNAVRALPCNWASRQTDRQKD